MADIRKTPHSNLQTSGKRFADGDEQWLCTGDVAKLTKFSASYFEKMRIRGRAEGPPWYNIRGRIRYLKSEVLAWLEGFRVQREESK